MLALITYCVAGILWGTYAYKKQSALDAGLLKLCIGPLINMILWPVCMVIATCRNV